MADSFQLKAILSAVDKISPTLKGVRRGLGMTHKSFRDLGSASRGLLGGVGLAGILSFSGLAYAAINAGQGALQYAGNLQDASDKTGMAIQAMQEYQTLFEAGGVAGDEFNDSVTKLNKGLAEAGAGKDKGLAGLLTSLRIPLRDAKGQIRSVEDVLPQLADAFEKNENPAVRTRMAMELFGKAGAKMIAVLMKGGNSMMEARREALRLGTVLSDVATARLDDLGDSFGLLSKQVKVQIAEAFGVAAPSIMAATAGLSEWIANNKVMLQQKLGGYIESIAKSFQGWVESGGIEKLGNGIVALVEGVGSFIDMMGGMQNVLIGVGVLMLVGPVASAVQLIAVLARMATYALPLLMGSLKMFGSTIMWVGRLLLANPILAVIAAIATAAYLIYDNWGAIGPWIAGLWEDIKGVFVSGMALLSGLFFNFHPLGMIIENWEPIVDWFAGLWSRISGFIEPIFNAAKAVGGAIASVVGSGPSSTGQAGQVLAARAGRGGMSTTQSGGSPIARGRLAEAGGLNGQQTANLNGELKVRFENAPPGMRVDQGRASQPGVSINPDVGYRSATVS